MEAIKTSSGDAAPQRRRFSQAERMAMIARAAAELFAERGFHATGTRDLAKASGVSEALIFRYFPTKEVLWAAALEACRGNAVADTMRSMPSAPASAASLVRLTLSAAESFLSIKGDRSTRDRDVINRLMLRSLASDGEFAKMVRNDLSRTMSTYIRQCLEAAHAAGELTLGEADDLSLLSQSYLAPMFLGSVWRMHEGPAAMRKSVSRHVVEQIVRAQLRSVGMTNAAIERHLGAGAG